MVLRDEIDVDAPPEAIYRFFAEMERYYLRWHSDHKLFKWVRGKGLKVGTIFYFEEVIAGKLLKKEVVFTRILPDLLEFAPTNRLMKLFLPSLRFNVQSLEARKHRVVAEIHLRIGPIAAWLNRRDLAAVREHMRIEGLNLKRIVEHEIAPRLPL